MSDIFRIVIIILIIYRKEEGSHMTGYGNEKRKTPKRFFWRLCVQSLGAFGVFLMVLWLFHTTVVGVDPWRLAVQESFTTDADLTSALERLYRFGEKSIAEMDAVQVSAEFSREPIKETIVIPVSGTVIPQGDQEEYLYVRTDGSEAILAAYAGTVTDIFLDEAQQLVICISHANGFMTTYGGCAECYVTLEEPVKKGQVIGRTAAIIAGEGIQSQADFYFTASYLGTMVNPLNLLQQRESSV